MLLRPTLTRPLLRLPSVLFPGQAVSLLRAASELQDSAVQHPFSVPEGMLAVARAEGDGAVACFLPGSRVACNSTSRLVPTMVGRFQAIAPRASASCRGR